MREEVFSKFHSQSFGQVRFSDKVERCIARYAAAGSTTRRATDEEVERLLTNAERTLTIASRTTVAAIRERNPDVMQVICTPGETNPLAIIAYLPLNSAGVEAVTQGKFSGLTPDPSQICASSEVPEALYIWLAFAPGALGRSLAAIANAYRALAPSGCPIFSHAVTPHSERLHSAMGFIRAADIYPDAPEWLVVALPVGAPEKARKASPTLGVEIARSFEDLMKIVAVRAATYLAEQLCLYDEEFDGNDLCATQFLGTLDGDPAGCVRLRFFGDFAKLERLAVRREYRSSRLAFRLVRTALAHARAKGYTRIYGHSRADLVPFWRMFGFEVIADRAPFRFANIDYREIVLDAEPDSDAIRFGVDPMVSIRPEGAWHAAGPLDLSNVAPDPVRAAMIERSMRKVRATA